MRKDDAIPQTFKILRENGAPRGVGLAASTRYFKRIIAVLSQILWKKVETGCEAYDLQAVQSKIVSHFCSRTPFLGEGRRAVPVC